MSLGIRPEHLLPSDIADVILEGEVQVVEQLGNETPKSISRIPSIRQNFGVPPERRGVGRRRCHIRYRPAARALPSVP